MPNLREPNFYWYPQIFAAALKRVSVAQSSKGNWNEKLTAALPYIAIYAVVIAYFVVYSTIMHFWHTEKILCCDCISPSSVIKEMVAHTVSQCAV